jgi:hypothetical protein
MMDLIFAFRRTTVNFLSGEWTPSRPKECPPMLRKTMIVSAKAAAALLWTLEQALVLR